MQLISQALGARLGALGRDAGLSETTQALVRHLHNFV